MTDISRRKAIGAVIAGGTELALRNISDRTAENRMTGTVQAARAFRGQHQPKPLSFNPTKLNGLSEKLIKSHWENNYGGAVKALNAVEHRLEGKLTMKDKLTGAPVE